MAHALLFYANVSYPFDPRSVDDQTKEWLQETSAALRGLAGRLRASLWTIPFYDSLARIRGVPSKGDVLEAATQLVGWSNSLYGRGDETRLDRRQKIIADRLGISKLLDATGQSD